MRRKISRANSCATANPFPGKRIVFAQIEDVICFPPVAVSALGPAFRAPGKHAWLGAEPAFRDILPFAAPAGASLTLGVERGHGITDEDVPFWIALAFGETEVTLRDA